MAAITSGGFVNSYTPQHNTTCEANFAAAKELVPLFANKLTCETSFGIGNCVENNDGFSPTQVGILIYARPRTAAKVSDAPKDYMNYVEPAFYGPTPIVLGPDALPRRYTATRQGSNVVVAKFIPKINDPLRSKLK